MKKVGRNDPCPCGSGKKFKKCHMGREDELTLDHLGEFSEEMSSWITALPEITYGRSREILDALDIETLTGSAMGIRFIDLKAYSELNMFGGTHADAAEGRGGGVLVNLHKTMKTDPHHVYIAISQDIDDSSLVHAIAHALDYLAGSPWVPGTTSPLSYEIGVPVEHLEHPEQFGRWLYYLATRFNVQLDADDSIVLYLYENKKLIDNEEIRAENSTLLKSKSDAIFRFLSENSQAIDALIRNRPGYIGVRETKD
jgi:hypothetical protein